MFTAIFIVGWILTIVISVPLLKFALNLHDLEIEWIFVVLLLIPVINILVGLIGILAELNQVISVPRWIKNFFN